MPVHGQRTTSGENPSFLTIIETLASSRLNVFGAVALPALSVVAVIEVWPSFWKVTCAPSTTLSLVVALRICTENPGAAAAGAHSATRSENARPWRNMFDSWTAGLRAAAVDVKLSTGPD